MSSQRAIRCSVMRGGTSKGLYFHASDLPSDVATRDAVLLAAMGSPDVREIDGMGGAHPLTSKVAVVGASHREDADVDYLFLQVWPDRAEVSDNQNCGNLLAGVGPFAIEEGLVAPSRGHSPRFASGCRTRRAWPSRACRHPRASFATTVRPTSMASRAPVRPFPLNSSISPGRRAAVSCPLRRPSTSSTEFALPASTTGCRSCACALTTSASAGTRHRARSRRTPRSAPASSEFDFARASS